MNTLAECIFWCLCAKGVSRQSETAGFALSIEVACMLISRLKRIITTCLKRNSCHQKHPSNNLSLESAVSVSRNCKSQSGVFLEFGMEIRILALCFWFLVCL